MQNIENKVEIETYLKQGNQLRKEGQLTQAIKQYKQVLELSPSYVPALAQLAVIYESRKELDQAINYFQQLIELKPNNHNFFRKLMAIYSKVLCEKNNIDEVIYIYQQITKVISVKLLEKAHKELGDVLIKLSIRQGKLNRAITFFKEATENQPDSPYLHYNLGVLFAKSNRLDEAISFYRKAIQLRPKFWQAYGELGICLWKKGDRDQGFDSGIKAFRLHPSLPIKYHQILRMNSSERLKIYKDTVQDILKKKENNNHKIYYLIGKKLYQNDEYEEATYYYQKTIYFKYQESNPRFVSEYWENGKLQEPNFLIIGVAKCGTTSLYSYLQQHLQFLPAIFKEPDYFNNLINKIKKCDKYGQQPLLEKERYFYYSHFPPRFEGSQFITGEASPTNIFPGVEEIVAHWLPKIKLIAILRNPVKRAISHYNELLKKNKNKHSLEKTVCLELEELEAIKEPTHIINRVRQKGHQEHLAPGLYVYYLKRWMNLFPREQFLILSNEDLAQNPAGVMKQTFDFLGLSEYDGIDYTPRNVGHYPKDIDPDLLSRLQDFYRPHNQKLEEFLGRKFNWD